MFIHCYKPCGASLLVCPDKASYCVFFSVHPVTIAEIDKVLPNVSEQTFNPDRDSIPFKSTVSVKLNTQAKWFDLPAVDETIPMRDISEKVYKERFSQE